MAQYDPQTVKGGVPTALGADTLRAEREAVAGLTTSAPTAGDACQVSATLTVQKAVNTSTSPVIGVYDGVSGSVVRSGIVTANRSGPVWSDGDTVYLSSTAGRLTKTKPIYDVLHEVGVVVDAANSKVLLQPKPVLTLPASPPLSLWFSSPPYIYQVASPGGGVLRTISLPVWTHHMVWDGSYLWVADDAQPSNVRKINPYDGTVAGGPYSIGRATMTSSNRMMAFDGVNYWISDFPGYGVVKFDSSGSVLATVSGLGTGYYEPTGFAYDGSGYLWCGRSNTQEVRKINVTTNAVTTYATCLPTGHMPRSGNGGMCVGGYFYLQTQVGSFSPVYYYVSKIRCSDGVCVDTHQIGVDIASVSSDIESDGDYLYVIRTQDQILKLRISDWNHEWQNGYGLGGTLALDGSGYVWGPDGTSMSQGVYVRVRTSDGAGASWNPMQYTVLKPVRSNGIVYPVA